MADVIGIAGLKQNFGQIRGDMETKTARAMVVAAGGVLKKRAKANAQAAGLVRTGSLVKNIAIKQERGVPSGTVQFHLGVRHGRDKTKKQRDNHKLKVSQKGRIIKDYQDDPYYWKFLEFTTKRRQATPFLATALEEGQAEAIAAMEARLQKELDKENKE